MDRHGTEYPAWLEWRRCGRAAAARRRLASIVPYHVGQQLLTLSLAA